MLRAALLALIALAVLVPHPAKAQVVGGVAAPPGAVSWQAQLLRKGESAALTWATAQAKSAALAAKAPMTGREGNIPVPEVWETDHICGGAYIGDRWILTAAHCIGDAWAEEDPKFFSNRQVRLGTKDLSQGGLVLAIDAVVRHAAFTGSTNGFDLALLRLAEMPGPGVLASPDVKPIAPATEEAGGQPLGATLRISGWGWTGATRKLSSEVDINGQRQRFSRQLMMGEISLLARSDCDGSQAYRERNIPHLQSGQICAGSETGVDTCRGDSGGPLVREGPEPILVGLVSFGPACGIPGIPGVYADVGFFQFNGWIDQAKAQAQPGMIIDYDDGECRHAGEAIPCLATPVSDE